MNISTDEYQRLKDIESRYNAIIERTLLTAKPDREHPGGLYFLGGAVRKAILEYHRDAYEKRRKEIVDGN